MKKSLFAGFGIAFLIWGVVLAVQWRSVTGLALYDGLEGSAASVLGGIFIALGIVLLVVSRIVNSRRKN